MYGSYKGLISENITKKYGIIWYSTSVLGFESPIEINVTRI